MAGAIFVSCTYKNRLFLLFFYKKWCIFVIYGTD